MKSRHVKTPELWLWALFFVVCGALTIASAHGLLTESVLGFKLGKPRKVAAVVAAPWVGTGAGSMFIAGGFYMLLDRYNCRSAAAIAGLICYVGMFTVGYWVVFLR